MGIVLARVDDRLIHGQVVEGWLRVIQATRIVVVSEEASADPIQQGLMRLAVPSDVRVDVLGVQTAAGNLRAGTWASDRVLLLLPGVSEARRLVEAGVELPTINLGGLHDAPGRVFLTPFLALNETEARDVQWLLEREISLDVRALPTDEKRDIRPSLTGRGGGATGKGGKSRG